MRMVLKVTVLVSLLLFLASGCKPAIEKEFVTLLQSTGDKVYLCVYNLGSGELALEKKLGTSSEYCWSCLEAGPDYNIFTLNTNEIYETREEGLALLGNADTNVVFAGRCKENIFTLGYNFQEELFFTLFSGTNLEQPTYRQKLAGSFLDGFVTDDRLIFTVYNGDAGCNQLYEFNSKPEIIATLDKPCRTVVAAYETDYVLAVGKGVSPNEKDENALYFYKPEEGLVWFTDLPKPPFDIALDESNIYLLADINSPHFYVLDRGDSSIYVDIAFDEYILGLKYLSGSLWVIGKRNIYKLSNGQLETVKEFKRDNTRFTLHLF